VYGKQLKLSAATNKKFNQGEVVNFVQVDAEKVKWNSYNLVYLTRYPLVILVCFIFLFHYLGYVFFVGIAMFGVALGINIALNRLSAKF
jgi:positive regulator of sigma E activity